MIIDGPNCDHIAAQVRNKDGQVVVQIKMAKCPRIFPHTVSGWCNTCAQLYEEKEALVIDTWNAARLQFMPPEAVPFPRRMKFMVTRLINWIGSWSKN